MWLTMRLVEFFAPLGWCAHIYLYAVSRRFLPCVTCALGPLALIHNVGSGSCLMDQGPHSHPPDHSNVRHLGRRRSRRHVPPHRGRHSDISEAVLFGLSESALDWVHNCARCCMSLKNIGCW